MKNKKQYNCPEINCISIDNEISLVLVSGYENPEEPGMYGDSNDVFKQNKMNPNNNIYS